MAEFGVGDIVYDKLDAKKRPMLVMEAGVKFERTIRQWWRGEPATVDATRVVVRLRLDEPRVYEFKDASGSWVQDVRRYETLTLPVIQLAIHQEVE